MLELTIVSWRQLRDVPLCISSPTYVIFPTYTHCCNYCRFSNVWPWLKKKTLCVFERVCVRVCVDSAPCPWVTWLLSCISTGFTDLHAQQPRDLKTRERGWYWGNEAWVTYHLMLLLLHNPLLSDGGKMLMKPWSRTMEDRGRKGKVGKRRETALFFGVSM